MPFQFQYGAIEGGCRSLKTRRWSISIPVWCDWRSGIETSLYVLSTFQFQYGAIEGEHERHKRVELVHFNSSMVRLKVAKSVFVKQSTLISIPVWCDWRHLIELFYNSIPSNFNSSMVRLKAGVVAGVLRACPNFNSSMVRLKAPPSLHVNEVTLFQFQYGAIEGFAAGSTGILKRYFNSSMVRLKGAPFSPVSVSHFISIPVWCDWRLVAVFSDSPFPEFQFQYGAIEGAMTQGNPNQRAHFNSSMVRLKDLQKIMLRVQSLNFNSSMVRLKGLWHVIKTAKIVFQFQYGAIEGLWWMPRWTSTRISIPVWCDWRTTPPSLSRPFCCISIPVWCDWRTWLEGVSQTW